jgi:hypothetical protein
MHTANRRAYPMITNLLLRIYRDIQRSRFTVFYHTTQSTEVVLLFICHSSYTCLPQLNPPSP